MEIVAALLGGLGLFLLGTSMMTEGLKRAAGGALRRILERWTRSPLRGLAAGFLITAIVRSSTAVTVAAIGFVNAGLLSLTQAIWVIFGTNLGTTTTAWLVAFVGIRFDIGALALPMLGVGMLLRLAAGARPRLAGAGEALAGFGAFFLGIEILSRGFAGLGPAMAGLDLPQGGIGAVLGFMLLGIVLTQLTQSSSAAIAIALTASAGGVLPLPLAAAAVIGTNIGTTSTALLVAIGATPPAQRVAAAHVAFNLLTGAAALILFQPLVAASTAIPGLFEAAPDMPTVLAVFHTLFNLLGVLLMWPLAGRLVRFLSARFATPDEALARLRHLDGTLLAVPELAVPALRQEVARMVTLAGELAGAVLRDPAAPRAAETARAIAALGRGIRSHVGRLNAEVMGAAQVGAIAHLLRAVQHAEAVAAEAAAIASGDPVEPAVAALPGFAAMREAALEALLPIEAAPETHRAAAAEAAYQAVKAALLEAAARRSITVAALDPALAEAQRMRRIADAVVKARRRIALAAAGRS